MSGEPSVDPIPEHLQTVTPRLVVRDGVAAIDFYRRAFGAEEIGGLLTERVELLSREEMDRRAARFFGSE